MNGISTLGPLSPFPRTLDMVSRPPYDMIGHFSAQMSANALSNISPIFYMSMNTKSYIEFLVILRIYIKRKGYKKKTNEKKEEEKLGKVSSYFSSSLNAISGP